MLFHQNTCRICGQISETCHSIFSKSPPTDLEEKIKKCLKLQDDFKPKQLCNACLVKLEDFSQFLSICHSTDQKFESMLNRQWGANETILDYTQQKMSVIVSTKPTLLECNEMDLYKESVLPLDSCMNEHEMLEIVGNTNYTNYFYEESTVLRHSSGYQESYCQQQTYDLNYANVGLDYSNYGAREPEFAANAEKKASLKSFQCPHCEKKFSRRISLSTHVATHTKIRPFCCDICKKTYATRCDLTNHQKSHTDRNKCQYCSRRFTAPSKLQRHLRTHTKDRPFVCDFKNCDKSFSDKRNLDGHKVLHVNVFDFRCKDCSKAFRTKNRLKQHARAHSGGTPYVCEVCSKAYKYKSTLIFHLKKHNGYFCPYCEKNCEKGAKLLKHKKACESRTK